MYSVDIKRCRRTSLDTTRYHLSSLIVPLLSPDLDHPKFKRMCRTPRWLSMSLTLMRLTDAPIISSPRRVIAIRTGALQAVKPAAEQTSEVELQTGCNSIAIQMQSVSA